MRTSPCRSSKAHHSDFARAASAVDLPSAIRTVHIASLAADERLVYFHVTAQFLNAALLHGETDAVQHEPCGLLRDAESAMYLVTGDAILGVSD